MIICLLNQAGSATSPQGGPTVSPGTRWCSTTSLPFVMRLGAHFIVTCKQASALATRASIANSEQWSAACSAGDADMNCWELDYESITEVFIWISARPYPTLVTYQSYISYNILKFCTNESFTPQPELWRVPEILDLLLRSTWPWCQSSLARWRLPWVTWGRWPTTNSSTTLW